LSVSIVSSERLTSPRILVSPGRLGSVSLVVAACFLSLSLSVSGVQAAGASGYPAAEDHIVSCWPLSSGRLSAAEAPWTIGVQELVTDIYPRLSPHQIRTSLVSPSSPTLAHPGGDDVPLWRVQRVSARLRDGRALSLVQGVNACLSAPLQELALTPQPMIQGQTAVLSLETDRLSFCRATFLGETLPCYREGNAHLYVLVGVSALTEPGVYPLRVDLAFEQRRLTFSLPLQVEHGGYGFQRIDAPPELRSLLDPGLMAAEEAYLERFRALRTTVRHWDFPLTSPLPRPYPISAAFGDRRSYGGTVRGYHTGIDYRVPTGVPVVAPADGVVVMAETLALRGHAVLIDHGWGVVTGYWHLSEVDVHVGQVVRRGTIIGRVGNTGLSTGAHLHWELWVNGVSVDGRQWLRRDGLEGVRLAPLHSDQPVASQ